MSGLLIDIPTFDIEVDGKVIEARTESWIRAKYPQKADGLMMAALRKIAAQQISVRAEQYRGRFVPLKPGKLTEYHIKERAARDAQNGDKAAQEDLALEADVRGLDVTDFIMIILSRAAMFRRLSLLIASIEAGALAAIESAATPPQIMDALEAAEHRAETAFAAVEAQGA